MKSFHIPTLIERKAYGNELSQEEIEYVISAVTNGEIQESQLGKRLRSHSYRSKMDAGVTIR